MVKRSGGLQFSVGDADGIHLGTDTKFFVGQTENVLQEDIFYAILLDVQAADIFVLARERSLELRL